MSKSPPLPKEQRSFKGASDNKRAARDRRDDRTGVQSPDPGDADVNLETQGRYGDIRQNLTPQRKTQDR